MAQLLDADGVIPGGAIIAAGYVGQIVYISVSEPKGITPAGWADHQVHGCKDAFVQEDRATDVLNASLMAAHATEVREVLDSLGLAGQSPVVHWACDGDVPTSSYPVAWQNVVNASKSANVIPGVYGPDEWLVYCSLRGCKYLFSAAGWRGTGDIPTIQQTLTQVEVGGMTCDVDDILASDYGQWPRLEEDDMPYDFGYEVRKMYRECLHREADMEGFTNFVNGLTSGKLTLNDVMATIQDSPEGQAALAAERKAIGLG